METPDQKTHTHPGHDGQVYFCHKCGWPFPKPHPSARHRRAHKKVCGTLEGYLVDNKSHLDGSDDGEQVSDDEIKSPCGKVVERTISRKSSSGVGSQSARSEDEVFADAATDFVDSPGFGEAMYGVMSRGNSLQNVAEFKLESSQLKEKNEDSDKELPTVNARELEGESEEMKAMQSHDHISSPSNNLDDSGMEERKVDAPSKDTVDERILGSELAEDNPEGAFALGDVSEESLYPVFVGGNVDITGNETTEIKGVVECSHDVNTPRNLQDPVHSVQVVEPADENAGKVTDMFEECNSGTEVNENAHVVAVPDALYLQENSDIAVENSDHKGRKFNIPMDSDAKLTVESLEFGESNASEESYTSTGFTKSGESNYVSSVGDAPKTVHSVEDMVNPELGPNQSVVEQNTVGKEVQISDDKTSDSDTIEFNSKDVPEDNRKESGMDQEVNSCTEQKPVVSTDNLYSKDEAAYAADDQEMTAKEDVNRSYDFKPEDKKFMVDDNFSEVPAGELAVTSPTSAESFELTVDHGRDDESYAEKVKIYDTSANENELRIGGEEVTDSIEARTAPGCGLTISGYSDKNDELFGLENEYDQRELSKSLVSDNMAVGHSQPESLLTLEDNMQEVQSKIGESICAVEESDDHIDSVLKTSDDAGSSCLSSDVVANRGVKRAADNVPSVTEDDKITKKHTSVLVPDTGDSSSQTESLEGNWGSVSVLSAISDASPATDMASSKNLQVLSEEATGVSSEPKVQEGPQHGEDNTPVESQSQESAGTSDIQTQHSVQQQSSAGGSHIVSHVLGGKREKEIMAKVNDWNSGKQHTALKTLLGEAIARSRAESPNHDDDSASVPKTDQVPQTNNGISSSTEKVTVVSKDSEMETCKEEIGKEWNSPARYPVNIKTEKKRSKSRPYWVPFLCCSSVNAR